MISTVMLVDRREETSRLRPHIEAMGWQVIEASNAGQARGSIARYKPEFIITELALPRVTGFELCANQKRENCRIPILVLTDLKLDSARNLAVWAGADGYLVRPFPVRQLYQRMLSIARAVRDRVRQAELGLQGSVEFTCHCGKRMSVGPANAGKAVICPKCQSLVKSPQMVVDSSVLFRQVREQSGMASGGHLGLYCDACSEPLDMRKHRRREGAKCGKCDKLIKLPRAIVDQWDFFFQDEIVEREPRDVDPLQFVHVMCPDCNVFHAFFDQHDRPQPCRQCGKQQGLPSVRGAALSKAALNATGRLFRIKLNAEKSALFLLPRAKNVFIGSEPGHALTMSNVGLKPKHCLLRILNGQPVAEPAQDAPVTLNGTAISGVTLLTPGDRMAMGQIEIRLLGNKEPSEESLMRTIFRRLEDENRTEGKPNFTGPGAQILQLHWEMERLRWIQANTSLAQAQS